MSIIISWKLCASSGEPNGQLLHCLYGNCRPPEETLPGRKTELASQLDQVTVEGSSLLFLGFHAWTVLEGDDCWV